MRLRIMFIDYSDKHADLMPNAVAICDEYMEDEHGGIPDFFMEEVEKARDGDYPMRTCFVTVPDDAIKGLFEPPVVEGKVTTQDW